MKELIKQLAREQKSRKSDRKTGTLPELKLTCWGELDWSAAPQILKDSLAAASDVRYNKARITAALNLYHELRGSDYRHNIPDDWLYQRDYNEAMEELRGSIAQ